MVIVENDWIVAVERKSGSSMTGIKGIEMATDFIRNRRPGYRNIEVMDHEHSRVSNGRQGRIGWIHGKWLRYPRSFNCYRSES